ncbi:MAG: hypothetical protein KGY66_06525 [Candidatus Thermoplasmatota archaeon]|nr:hypothetical protein [Candidatus Thermoplasmatota archaeon]MBS3790553.1 hypothetical protein [Candidatus Thermoplasmatota archaeon]
MTEAKMLEVEKSPIESGGRARVNKTLLEKLSFTSGDLVVVSSDKKDILVTIFGDDLIEEDKIKLRVLDVEKLGVEEGEEISIREHKKLLTKLI